MVKLVKRAPPAAKSLRGSHELAIELSSNETAAESRVVVAQNLWGEGDLTPYDSVFASAAVMSLGVTTNSSFAAVVPHRSGELTRFSEEIGVWIDVLEVASVRFSLDRRRADKIKRGSWTPGKGLLPKGKFAYLYLAQPSFLAATLGAIYREAADGMKSSGALFLADIFIANPAVSDALPSIQIPGSARWQSVDAHLRALADAKLNVDQEFDLNRDVLMAIRDGFLRGVGKLSDIRALEQPWRNQRQTGFMLELETWFKLYRLIELGAITAKAYICRK